DDAGLATMPGQDVGQLPARVFLERDPVADVRAVETGDEPGRLRQAQAFGDLAPGRRIGGGGQGDARHLRPALVQDVELAVLGPEVVAPLRDAVRLVDGEQGQAAAL